MRFLSRTFLLSLFALPILAVTAVGLCFQDAPSVARGVELTPHDIENTKRIIDQHDPRRARAGSPQTVTTSKEGLDLMLNYAANRFGELAKQSPERARKLAQALASGANESDFMPDVADLPQYLQEAEFKRRYGGIGGPGYKNMMATIDARVASRLLLR